MFTKKIIRLGLLDDHQIVIDGLNLLLQDVQEFKVIVEDTSSTRFLHQLNTTTIDIALLDILMPKQLSGIEVALAIKKQHPTIRILILSMNDDIKTVHQLLEDIQVDGFISKSAGKEELVEAINTIYNGKKYFSKEILHYKLQYVRALREVDMLHLSKRELEIVTCIEKRYSNKQIADELFISERTVETHRKNIYRKTNTKGEAALIAYLKEVGVLK